MQNVSTMGYRNDAVLDMLNTRYLIVPGDGGQPEAVLRPTPHNKNQK